MIFKNTLLGIIVILMSVFASSVNAQTDHFKENFDVLPITQFSNTGNTNWDTNTVYQVSPNNSVWASTPNPNDTAVYTSTVFSTKTSNNVYLEFDHICKVHFYHDGIIEVSKDSGNTWVQLDRTHYEGNGLFESFGNSGDRFNAGSYNEWDLANNSLLPEKSWWRHESFDISSLVADSKNVMIRFTARVSSYGGLGNYGWLIDNVRIYGAVDELRPPEVTLLPPFVVDTMYDNGPYSVIAEMSDTSGIDTAFIILNSNNKTDTIGMEVTIPATVLEGVETRKGVIPSQPFQTTFSYQVVVVDKSATSNETRVPQVFFEEVYVDRPLDEVKIGAGLGSSDLTPLCNDSVNSSKKYSQHVSIFTAAEMRKNPGEIIKLSWEKADTNSYIYNDAQLKIYVKHTLSDTVRTTAGSFNSEKSDATLVYESSMQGLPNKSGWMDFEFNVGTFNFDGIQNLMVMVEWYRPQSIQQNHLRWKYSYSNAKGVTFAGEAANPTVVYAYNLRPNIRLFLEPKVYNVDIGVYEILKPIDLSTGTTNKDIEVNVKNYGSDTITSFDVYYKINNNAPVKYEWTGILPPDLVTPNILMGTENIDKGTSTIKCWTTNPNSGKDDYTNNDSLRKEFYICQSALAGTYKVGGANADYNNLKEVEDAISNCGLSDDVIFEFEPGVYNGQINIEDIDGLNSSNTLTFKSSTNNANDVVFTHKASSYERNYVLAVNNQSWFTIKNITFEATGYPYTDVIALNDSIDNVVIDSCIIKSVFASNVASNGVLLLGKAINLKISNNKFYDMHNAINVVTTSNRISENVSIENNILTDIYRNGISVRNQKQLSVSGNIIYSKSSSSYFNGINLVNCNEGSKINKNNVSIETPVSAIGIIVDNCDGISSSPVELINNFVNINGSSNSYGVTALDVNKSGFVNIYHNTFALHTGSSQSVTVSIDDKATPPSQDINLLNNIFSHHNYGLCFENTTSSANNGTIKNSDYNNFYSNSTTYAKWGGKLIFSTHGIDSLTDQSKLDSNSYFSDPMYYSKVDIHSFSQILDSAATPIAGVTTDIDGDLRDVNNPDIGADEFDVLTYDVGILALINPIAIDTQNRVTSPMIVVRNIGSLPITTMDVFYKVDGGAAVSYKFNGNISPLGVDTISLPQMTIPLFDFSIEVYAVLKDDIHNSNDTIRMDLYGNPLVDIEMVNVVSPIDGCELDSVEVIVNIKNNGFSKISNGLSLSYIVNGSTAVTDVVANEIGAESSYTHTFSKKVDMFVVTDSTFNFTIYSTHTLDAQDNNDTIKTTAVSLGILPDPEINDTTITYSHSVSLFAKSDYNTVWYDADTNVLASGPIFVTPRLFDTTKYFVESNTNIPALNEQLGFDVTVNAVGDKFCVYDNNGADEKQILVLASELQAMGLVAGKIISLSFYAEKIGVSYQEYIPLKMGHTTEDSLTSRITEGMILVDGGKDNGVIMTLKAGWNKHNFDTPFEWDGKSNIVISMQQYKTTGAQLHITPTSFKSVSHHGSSIGIPSGYGYDRPNMIFGTAPVDGCAGNKVTVMVNVPLDPIEAKMSALTKPVTTCGISTATIACEIVNMGRDTIPAGFVVSYQINNGGFIPVEAVSNSIAPDDTLEYEFLVPASLPSGPNGTNYSITLALDVNGDKFYENDTLVVNNIVSNYTPDVPTLVTTVSVVYGNSTSLSGTSTDTIYWLENIEEVSIIDTGYKIQYGPVFDSTTVYAYAQKTVPLTTYDIGTGKTFNTSSVGPSPFGGKSSQSQGIKTQFLIHRSELAAMGMVKGLIKSVAFDVITASGYVQNKFNVSLGNTNVSELTGMIGNLTEVFYRSQWGEQSGWSTIVFDEAFFWDGKSNLVVQVCFEGPSWASGYAAVRNTATTFKSSIERFLLPRSTPPIVCSDTLYNNFYRKRPNIRFTATGYGECKSQFSETKINVTGYPAIDVGIASILSPGNNLSSLTSDSIVVVLKNYGTETLTNVDILWKERDTVIHKYLWSGNIPFRGVDTIKIADHTFKGGYTILDVWTSNPNGKVDLYTANDSASKQMDICMSGTYTVGNSKMDYTKLQDAFDDLVYSSACGPVVLDIDSGVYHGNITVPYIPGSSESNSITIKSLSNDSTKVRFTASTTPTYNYVIKLSEAEYFTIKNITISASGTDNANAVLVADNSHHISIENCVLNSSATTNRTAKSSGVYVKDEGVDFVFIRNNIINNGRNAIFLEGDFHDKMKGCEIEDNTCVSFSYNGIWGNYHDSVKIAGNSFTSNINNTEVVGIELKNTVNGFEIRRNKIILMPVAKGIGIELSGDDGTSTKQAVVANNMVSLISGNKNQEGIYLWNCEYVDIVYNSVNITNGNSDNIAGYFRDGKEQSIKNNIFVTNKGYLMNVNNPGSITACDYNNYYTDSLINSLFVFWTSDIPNLNALKVVDSEKNQNSLNIDPVFHSNEDLHVYELGLKAAGVKIAHTAIDFDKDVRDVSNPDIGADEFPVFNTDITLVEFAYPMQNGCGFSNTDSIVVTVKNNGLLDINFATTNAYFELYSTGVNPDTVKYTLSSGVLKSGEKMNVKIASSFNLSLVGEYLFAAELMFAGDQDTNNNSLPVKSFVSYKEISVLPFYEDFESGTSNYLGLRDSYESTAEVNTVSVSAGKYSLNLRGGDYSSYNNPANVDDAFKQTNYYASLYTCQVDATKNNALRLKFDMRQTYYQNAARSWFRVMIEDANGRHYAVNQDGESIFQAATLSSDPFETHTFDLSKYAGQVISVHMEAILASDKVGNNMGDNVFIDEVSIWEPSQYDVALKSVYSFNIGFAKTTTKHTAQIIVENFGFDTITSLPIKYTFNNSTFYYDTIACNIPPAVIDTLTFNNDFRVNSGDNNITVIAGLVGDNVSLNDTVRATLKGLDLYNLDYSDDFEKEYTWYGDGTNKQWQYGAPSTTIFTSAYSGTNAMVTLLESNYITESVEYLYTPFFRMPSSQTDTVTIEFKQQMQVFSSLAYGYMEYSLDGARWNHFGYIDYPGSEGWYTLNEGGLFVWSDQNTSWINSKLPLNPIIYNKGIDIQFRFVFKTKSSSQTLDGWMIDDFTLTLPDLPLDAGVSKIISPVDTTMMGALHKVEVEIKNYGTDTLYQIPVAYKTNLTSQVSEIWTGVLYPDSTVNYVFATELAGPTESYKLCSYTRLSGDLRVTNDSTCIYIEPTKALWDAKILGGRLIKEVAGNGSFVELEFMNNGLKAFKDLPVSYVVGPHISQKEIVPNTLKPGDTLIYRFNELSLEPSGYFLFCGSTYLPNDMVAENDTFCKVEIAIGDIEKANFVLKQNVPNPFNGNTIIEYEIPKVGDVKFKVIDVIGKAVYEETHKDVKMKYSKTYNFNFLSPGIYYYSIEFEGNRITKKMIIQ